MRVCSKLIAVIVFCAGIGQMSEGSGPSAGHPTGAVAGLERSLPIRLRIGSISPQFNCSRESVRLALAKAIALWEEAAARNLFTIADDGFPVDLQYDERQMRLNLKRASRQNIASKRRLLEEQKSSVSAQRQIYDLEATRYNSKLEDYSERLESYNRQVRNWNLRGGAPDDVYDDLQRTKRQLAWEKDVLDSDLANLESSRRLLNRLVQDYNDSLDTLNRSVTSHNLLFGGGQTTQVGECITKGTKTVRIAVFAYEDETDLVSVLAHELGHALGMRHVSSQGSVMSAIDTSSASERVLRLSYADRGELMRVLRG